MLRNCIQHIDASGCCSSGVVVPARDLVALPARRLVPAFQLNTSPYQARVGPI